MKEGGGWQSQSAKASPSPAQGSEGRGKKVCLSQDLLPTKTFSCISPNIDSERRFHFVPVLFPYIVSWMVLAHARVCVRVWARVSSCVYVFVMSMCACVCVSMCMCVCPCVFVLVCSLSFWQCTCVCVCARARVCVCVCECARQFVSVCRFADKVELFLHLALKFACSHSCLICLR